MSFEIKKVYTENPYVDEMVYYSKLMGIDTVLKMQDVADRNETAESLKAGGLYISCMENTAIVEEFPNISFSAFSAAGIVDADTILEYRADPSKIPESAKPKILKVLKQEYIANYVELNSYYRMLNGLPPQVGQVDYVTEYWTSPEGIKLEGEYEDGTFKPVHEMSTSDIMILERYGILEDMMQDEADDGHSREYMRYLGKKKIDFYTARRANRFDALYVPTIDSDSIQKMYRDKLDENKFYVLRTVYSEAFKYNSDYYDNFIAVFIVLITVIDIISRVQEFVARKEIFDIRSVQYIFQSNGVPFFEEIPLKYQIAMVKNLHTFLKYKSTSKCMVDICSLFGFKNIKIFKYYLLRDRKINSEGYIHSDLDKDDPNYDPEEEYSLRFLKLPLEDDLDDYIRSSMNYVDYDEIADGDPKWYGGLEPEIIKKEILKQQFNFTRSKYLSIDTIYEIAKMSAQQSYFFNFLYDNIDYEGMLTISIPYISTSKEFRVSDIFTLLTTLTYMYNGVKDTIMDTQSKVLYVNGFNFKADLGTLAADIQSKIAYDTDFVFTNIKFGSIGFLDRIVFLKAADWVYGDYNFTYTNGKWMIENPLYDTRIICNEPLNNHSIEFSNRSTFLSVIKRNPGSYTFITKKKTDEETGITDIVWTLNDNEIQLADYGLQCNIYIDEAGVSFTVEVDEIHTIEDLNDIGLYYTDEAFIPSEGETFTIAVTQGIVLDSRSTDHAQEQVDKFIIPKTTIPSFGDMMNIFVNNMDVRDELIYGMRHADDKKIYDIYKSLYDALMIVELTMDYYKNPETGDFYRDSEGDATYTEYLRNVEPILYSVLVQVEDFEDTTSRNQYIATLIDSIVYALEQYIDTDEFQALFVNLPVMSIESVKQYMMTVINFYKSFKVDFLGINSIYIFDDDLDGVINIIDKMELYRYFERPEFLEIKEQFAKNLVTTEKDTLVELKDRLYFDIYTWVEKYCRTDLQIKDKKDSMISNLILNTIISICESMFYIKISRTNYDHLHLGEIHHKNTSVFDGMEDDIGIWDRLFIYEEGETYSPFMSKVDPSETGRIIVASEAGEAVASANIVDEITDNSVNTYLIAYGLKVIEGEPEAGDSFTLEIIPGYAPNIVYNTSGFKVDIIDRSAMLEASHMYGIYEFVYNGNAWTVKDRSGTVTELATTNYTAAFSVYKGNVVTSKTMARDVDAAADYKVVSEEAVVDAMSFKTKLPED